MWGIPKRKSNEQLNAELSAKVFEAFIAVVSDCQDGITDFNTFVKNASFVEKNLGDGKELSFCWLTVSKQGAKVNWTVENNSIFSNVGDLL